ncbi:MAG TPA: glutathionylspermidine synthase family protein [Polyangiaceae bacterium]
MRPSVEVVPIGGGDPLREVSLARELASRFLVWDAFVAGRRRVDVHPLLLPADMHAAAVRVAEGVVAAVGRVAARAHDDAVERARYGFDEDVVRLASASRGSGDDASLMRVDLLLDESGAWKACEINADCPGGHNESLGLPRLARAAGFLAGHDPTHLVAGLVARLRELAGGGTVGILHATGYAEDLQVCALVARELHRAGVRSILAPPTAPRLRGGDLCIHGEPVRALYRYFPTEWMSGQRNIPDIARAVAFGRVRTLTSFAHIYAQSKLAFARAWSDAPSNLMPETRDLREAPREMLLGNRRGWVVKRAMGRVGDEVFVGELFRDDDWAAAVDGARSLALGGEAWIAQRFVRQRAVPTPWGDRLVTLGAYVQDGRFAGYFARITPESHVSHDALCVPVFALGAAS